MLDKINSKINSKINKDSRFERKVLFIPYKSSPVNINSGNINSGQYRNETRQENKFPYFCYINDKHVGNAKTHAEAHALLTEVIDSMLN